MTAFATKVPTPSYVSHAAPHGVFVRGTVVVTPGRGENAAVYTRLATRLAVDGYRVVVLDQAASGDELTALLHEQAAAGPAPVVLIGSDTGAITALELASRVNVPLAGVVLAGLPVATPESEAGSEADDTSTWDDELDARTACPVHRGRLEADATIRRGALLSEPVPAWTASSPKVPALVIHGAADRISPLQAISEQLRGAVPRIVVVDDGLHDALNDKHHRSVAAEIVGFLEALRRDPQARPVLSEVTL